jgi:hypothetical protein
VDSSISWLMEGDPAVRWQVQRDLLDEPAPVWERERDRIATSGWGARLLDLQDPDGGWGGGLYSPKWTSTTYTLLLLFRFGLAPGHPAAVAGCRRLLDEGVAPDGGIDFSRTVRHSETCITGMVSAIATWFRLEDERTEAMTEYLLREQMADGGWNCRRWKGATHSSFHTTISVLEATAEYRGRHSAAVAEAGERGREFLLAHRFYRSHRTGKVVDSRLTRFSFPPRWYYDVLRGLDHFQAVAAGRDERAADALAVTASRRRPDGTWPLQNRHPGRVHFELEPGDEPSRWNTLRALRVMRWWERGDRPGTL